MTNDDLPEEFIKDIKFAIKEIKEGKVSEFKFDDNLEYIPDLIKDLTQKAIDIDWSGDKEKASAIWRRVGELTKKLHRGEQYEPRF